MLGSCSWNQLISSVRTWTTRFPFKVSGSSQKYNKMWGWTGSWVFSSANIMWRNWAGASISYKHLVLEPVVIYQVFGPIKPQFSRRWGTSVNGLLLAFLPVSILWVRILCQNSRIPKIHNSILFHKISGYNIEAKSTIEFCHTVHQMLWNLSTGVALLLNFHMISRHWSPFTIHLGGSSLQRERCMWCGDGK